MNLRLHNQKTGRRNTCHNSSQIFRPIFATEPNVALRALNGPELDISTAQGKLMLNLLASISEFERDLLRERIKSGVAHARSKGTKSGKPIGRPANKMGNEIQRLLAEGKSIRNIAKTFGISKTTVQKVKNRLSAL
jgi:DNA invertase Pin-like site-specific DNA recombinase